MEIICSRDECECEARLTAHIDEDDSDTEETSGALEVSIGGHRPSGASTLAVHIACQGTSAVI